MNVIARLEYELAYNDSAVHRFNHYTTRAPLDRISLGATTPGKSGPGSDVNSPKLQNYWNLTIRLFSSIARTLVGGVLPLCREAVGEFYTLSRFDKMGGCDNWLIFGRKSILNFELSFIVASCLKLTHPSLSTIFTRSWGKTDAFPKDMLYHQRNSYSKKIKNPFLYVWPST